MLHNFYAMWKGFFPDLKVTPADWPKQSLAWFRKENLTKLDRNLFFGKLAYKHVDMRAAQKALEEGDPGKVWRVSNVGLVL